MVSGKHPIPQQEKKAVLRRWDRRLRAFDFWRLLIALGLALVTCSVIRRQGADSSYASWREIKNVQVTLGNQSLAGNLYVLPQTFQVDLNVAVDALHRTGSYQPEQFGIEINEQRLLAVLNSLPQNNSADPQVVDYTITEADVVTKPAGVVVRGVAHANLKIKCDRIGVREVPVRLTVDRNQEESGWTYECVPLTSVVRVTGPEYMLSRIKTISTEMIVPKDTQTYHGMIGLVKPADMPELSLSMDHIEYEVIPQKDSKELVTRAFNHLQIYFLMRGDSMLEPKFVPGESSREVDIHLRGPSKILKGMSIEDLRVVCDLTPYTMAGKQNVKLGVLDLPDGVKVVEILPRGILAVELGYRHDGQPEPVVVPEVVPVPSAP